MKKTKIKPMNIGKGTPPGTRRPKPASERAELNALCVILFQSEADRLASQLEGPAPLHHSTHIQKKTKAQEHKLERVPPQERPGWSNPLCCVGRCLNTATWRFQRRKTEGRMPYCDRHLPEAANAPAWHLRFAPVGNPHKSQVSSYELLKVIEQGFADGAVEVTVRRAG